MEKELDTPPESPHGKIIGEMRVTFYEGDGLDVSFPTLGLLTLGRLERTIPYLYNKLILARQVETNKALGLPGEFNMRGAN